MSGRHSHGAAAPRLVQRTRPREHRGRFVVAGPAADGAALAGEGYRAALAASPERVEDAGSWRSTAQPRAHGAAIETDHRHASANSLARQHEHGWPGQGSAVPNGPGTLVWGARIDERLDRLERLIEVASTRCESAEEQVAAVLRRCSDQREELEELRFEFRRKPPERPAVAAPPPEPRQPNAEAAGVDVQELAVQVQALQRHCDTLAPRMNEMQANIGASQRQDIADKVARAISKESKRTRVELSGMRDEVNSTVQQTQRLGARLAVPPLSYKRERQRDRETKGGRETERQRDRELMSRCGAGRETDASITAVKRRLDEWELSATKTEQTLMTELHELSRSSAEVIPPSPPHFLVQS